MCSGADFAACPPTDRNTLSVDTRDVANGRHALSLRITDAAGNRHDEQVGTVDVRNIISPAPEAQLDASPASLAQLTATFARSSRPTLTVPFGTRVAIRGRLAGLAQPDLAGATVRVFERTATVGARELAVGTARTRDSGTFSYTLTARRPSRTVRLAYGSTSAPLLRVRVRAASTLRASLHGTTLRFSGRVLSRPLPPRGKRLLIEGTAPGFAWGKVASVRTDRRGRFFGTYRLAVRRPGVRLRIRVRIPTERGYPYLGYTGPPVLLTVR